MTLFCNYMLPIPNTIRIIVKLVTSLMIAISDFILVLLVKRSYKKIKASKSITLYFLKRTIAKTGFVDFYPNIYLLICYQFFEMYDRFYYKRNTS